MPTIIVTKPFKFAIRGVDVREYGLGEHDVTDRCAEVAIEEEWARLSDGGAAVKPEGDALTAAIAAVIDDLDPDNDFTSDGSPSTQSLQREFGYPVSAAERDAAWAIANE